MILSKKEMNILAWAIMLYEETAGSLYASSGKMTKEDYMEVRELKRKIFEQAGWRDD